MTSNHRKWKRFSGCLEKVTFYTKDQVRYESEIINESFGGIAMLVDYDLGLRVGQDLTIYIDECRIVVTIANISPHRGGKYRIGAHWRSIHAESNHESEIEQLTPEEERILQTV